jgi:RNA polymerase sigma factor (TIGR02999 family)
MGHEVVRGELSKPEVPAADTDASRGGDRPFALLYDELYQVASRELRRNASAPLRPTTLLHETFLSFSSGEPWELTEKRRFMAYAARAMHGLIIDYLRRGNAQKRGGGLEIVALPEELPADRQSDIEIERLREALDTLRSIDARLAECVDLKFFCGFSPAEIAQLWNVSERTVHRDWDKARLILSRLVGSADLGPWGIS